MLDEKNGQTFQTGMLVCLRIGLENLTTGSKDDQGKKYALLLNSRLALIHANTSSSEHAAGRKLRSSATHSAVAFS